MTEMTAEHYRIRRAAQRVVAEMSRAPQHTQIPATLGLALLELKLEIEKEDAPRPIERTK